MNTRFFNPVKLFLFLSFLPTLVLAQKAELTLEDAILGPYTKFRVDNLSQLQWQPETHSYSWRQSDSILIQNVTSDESLLLICKNGLNGILTKAEKEEISFLPSSSWTANKRLRFQSAGLIFEMDIDKRTLIRYQEAPDKARNIDISELAISYTIGNNLFVQNMSNEEIQITHDDVPGIVNGQTVHRNEFGISKGTFWSPDGNFLAFYRKDESMVSDYPLVNVDTRIAEIKNVKYPMAGMKSEEVTLWIYSLEMNKSWQVQTVGPKEQYLTNVAWSPDEEYIYLAVLNRGQDHMKLNKYNATDGSFVETLFDERHPKYVEPLKPVRFLKKDPNQFIWESRRDGFNHLYLYDISGKLIKQLTSGKFDVTDILGFDSGEKKLFYVSTQESPLERHLYELNLKNGKVVKLSLTAGTHSGILSSDGKYLIDSYTSIEVPRRIDLLKSNGKKLKTLLSASNPFKNYELGDIKVSKINGNEEHPDLYYRLIKPVNFDPSIKYPVIVYVYGGPHSQLVTNSWLGGSRMWQHYMAQKGYIAFTLDNRGTLGRGFDFENSIHRQLGVLEMKDQMAGIEYLKSLPWVDKTTLGIHGWSYGGFMTAGLMLQYPGTFKVAVAGGPVIDWKYYEIMYGERYMDTPEENPEGYKNSALKNYVKNLDGNLLIIHGAMDSTVVMQNSMSFLQECVKEGVQVDFFVYPGHPHNVRGRDRVHLMRKVSEYFDEKLGK